MKDIQKKRIFSLDGQIIYEDSLDHYQNGVLRLLGQPDELIEDFFKLTDSGLESTELSNLEEVCSRIHIAWNLARVNNGKLPLEFYKETSLRLETCFGPQIFNELIPLSGNPKLSLALNRSLGFGVLVDSISHVRIKNIDTDYEQEYFNGDLPGIGYGDFSEQTWRLEKATKQAKNLQILFELIPGQRDVSEMSFLDVGSGYGHFLNSLKVQGAVVKGLDISDFAASAAWQQFGIETSAETLVDFVKSSKERFDAISMWDYIEHPDDPGIELDICHSLLHPNGLLIIKTPNIEALEFEVFSSDYHSLKKEHLNYFSLRSLTLLLISHGFKLVYSQGISHIFGGLKNIDLCSLAIANKKESDIFVIAQKI
jgi:2-polyprenyl-3-methyl-5-hydroxy-6-metoxy-1,4-benzoquinol methylase